MEPQSLQEQKLTKWPDCDVCGKPVPIEKGGLGINRRRAGEIKRTTDRNLQALREKAAARTPKGVLPAYTLAELADAMPTREPWVIGHRKCLPDDGVYWIEATRFDTPGKALHWTLSLAEKPWVDWPEWQKAVRRIHRVPD